VIGGDRVVIQHPESLEPLVHPLLLLLVEDVVVDGAGLGAIARLALGADGRTRLELDPEAERVPVTVLVVVEPVDGRVRNRPAQFEDRRLGAGVTGAQQDDCRTRCQGDRPHGITSPAG
jgi:hypothetical protein